MKLRKIVWFARGSGIGRAGPFANQIEAAAAMELDNGRGKPVDFATWPEYEVGKMLKLKPPRRRSPGYCAASGCTYEINTRDGICYAHEDDERWDLQEL